MIRNKKLYYIDSNQRLSGDHTSFTYQIDIPKTHNYTHVCVVDAAIPKSWYISTSPYNTFLLVEQKQSITVTLPVGNYSAKSLQSVLATLLTASSTHGWTYSISFPNSATTAQTGLYTFTVSGNGASQPSFQFPSNSTLYEVLGFQSGSTNAFVANTLLSVNVLKLVSEDTVYIHSDIAKEIGTDILQHIFVSGAQDYSTIKYTSYSIEANSKALANATNNIFKFSLTNEAGIPISTNGLNWNMVIMIYEQDNIFQLLKDFMALQLIKESGVGNKAV